MNLTSSNIKQLVSNCNCIFSIQNESFKLTFHHLLDTDEPDTVAGFMLVTHSNEAVYKKCLIELHKDNSVIISIYGCNKKFKISLERKVEIEQLIIFALTEYMMYGIPPKWIITQSISGWTNAKVVFNQNGKHTCIHTVVIKQLMLHNIAEIINAKFSSNGSIIVDSKNYKKTNFHCGPNNMWWD